MQMCMSSTFELTGRFHTGSSVISWPLTQQDYGNVHRSRLSCCHIGFAAVVFSLVGRQQQ